VAVVVKRKLALLVMIIGFNLRVIKLFVKIMPDILSGIRNKPKLCHGNFVRIYLNFIGQINHAFTFCSSIYF